MAAEPRRANLLEDRLLMALIYYRLYLTQEFMTLLFNVANKSVICRNIQLTRSVLEAVLPVPERARRRILAIAKTEAARRQKRIGTVEEFVEAYPELTFLIDGVEQEKRKPKDKEERKNDYSGKKKKHTPKANRYRNTGGHYCRPESECQRTSARLQGFPTRL